MLDSLAVRKRIVASRWLLLVMLLLPLLAAARGGSGEHYKSSPPPPPSHTAPRGSTGHGSYDHHGGGALLQLIIVLTIEHPAIMIPLLLIAAFIYFQYQKANDPTERTQRAFEEREARQRTQVSSRDVEAWVAALKAKDPAFELLPLLDKVKRLFRDLQEGWFQRDLSRLRPFVSDATYQRLGVQLKLLEAQGVRDALADLQVLDLQIIGLDQSPWFDTVHLRIRARMRDTDVSARMPDEEAIAEAMRAPLEPFVEVWSFVRKPGAPTKIGEDVYQGKCPNCGAPFQGGASNSCEFCGAVVNSGNYDWTLSEITQGIEHTPGNSDVEGLSEARQADPALNLEILEDRASLIFWRWIDAQSAGDARRLAKVAAGAFVEQLDGELSKLKATGRRKVFLECAVGGVAVKVLRSEAEGQRAHVEIRWSARMGIGPEGVKPPSLPAVPQRWMFTLARKAGATTRAENGMATFRCPQCNAALTDSASPSCDYCGALLNEGERDWVLAMAQTYEGWISSERQARQQPAARGTSNPGVDVILDIQERERLLYMMAALATTDGQVSESERKLLRLCSERWNVPWLNVERALTAGPQLFERLLPRSTPEAEVFLRSLVNMALVDGKIDRQERRMLQNAAQHLGIADRLRTLLAGK